jgi:hypothetical protein
LGLFDEPIEEIEPNWIRSFMSGPPPQRVL